MFEGARESEHGGEDEVLQNGQIFQISRIHLPHVARLANVGLLRIARETGRGESWRRHGRVNISIARWPLLPGD